MKALYLSLALVLVNAFVFTSETAIQRALKDFCEQFEGLTDQAQVPSGLQRKLYFWTHLLEQELSKLVDQNKK